MSSYTAPLHPQVSCRCSQHFPTNPWLIWIPLVSSNMAWKITRGFQKCRGLILYPKKEKHTYLFWLVVWNIFYFSIYWE